MFEEVKQFFLAKALRAAKKTFGIRKKSLPYPGSRVKKAPDLQLDPSILFFANRGSGSRFAVCFKCGRVVSLDHRKKKENSICTLGKFNGFFSSFLPVLYRNKEYKNIVILVQ
jgi:hypothetical protein